MRLIDGFLLLLIVLPPLLHYWHGRRILAKGRSATQVAVMSVGYTFMPMLCLLYVFATDFGERLEAATGSEGASVLAIWVPLMLGQWLHLYPAYRLDREARQVDWSFLEYVKVNGRFQVLLAAFFLPMIASGFLLDSLPFELDSWLIVLPMVAPGVLCAWLAWRWSEIRYEPVEPVLLARLSALCQEHGLTPRAIKVMPLRGGKVANAFVMGLRPQHPTILLTDYLLQTCSPEQVEVILAHEIGHAKLGHLRTRLWLALGSSLAVGGLIFGWMWLAGEVLHLQESFLFIPIMFLGMLPTLLIMPLIRRQEFEADRWAAQATGRGAELAATLEYLEQLNQVETAQLPRWIRLMAGHPITIRRAEALREITS